MASDTQTKTCLDIAVDHRIRKLLKPVPRYTTDSSPHVSRLEQEGRSLRLPRAEIQVTAQLAGPPVKGGIVVMLQQPRHNHPFEEGLGAVIDSCETLRALEDIFTVVSCGTLDFREDIAVVDLLPYVSGDPRDVDNTRLRNAFLLSTATIYDKSPDVLLCAGKIMMPLARAKAVKGSSYMLENIGIGEQFRAGSKWPDKARFRPEGQRAFVAVPKVNGFHPSHAMNYHSHVSHLRQLLILIGAEACGMYRSDWENSIWMDELRLRCKEYTSRTVARSTRSPTPMSPGRDETRRSSTKYIPEYQELYSKTLVDIRMCVSRLIPTDQGYEVLLNSGLSEKCNDASLMLRQMHRLQERGWPESVAWKNEAALEQVAADTYQFATDTYHFVKTPASKAARLPIETPLARALRENLDLIFARATVVQRRKEYDFSLKDAANDFLDLAVEIETLLLNLLQKKEAALNAQGLEDVLSEKLSGLTLAPVATRVAVRDSRS
ncbi:uncharacterized protein LY79DRAFT_555172 [Colletotrichum navitas]|uniref:Uncharacterized protein n=1 Tax=Colletotrichum navitas TaxID=681940 RepID=A0AAD8PZS1_9PEZI|nr:uncharacterized protein LY79DRAFT_555172 [Colletotrichum navitas]KAK1590127.1 hypothetical protein LY79DRAFT_555172 [Colletotrichum navitas]